MFVVREIRLIEGTNGYFLAMPSKKIEDRCPYCSAKNQLRSRYCSSCGKQLQPRTHQSNESGETKFFADICHPIKAECRQMIHDIVIAAYKKECALAETMDADYTPKEIWTLKELADSVRHEKISEPPPDEDSSKKEYDIP
jgi:stage V sporulation protein G